MKDDHLQTFFEAILDDELEAKIVGLILDGKDDDKIIETLLKNRKLRRTRTPEAKDD